MEINRNQYFMAGIIILLLGIQLRLVDSYVLSPQVTKVLAKQTGQVDLDRRPLLAASSLARKVVRPPEWAGWFLMSVGSVLVLHSLAMKRPD